MAIGRRKLLAGSAALWAGAPAILKAQSSSNVHVGHGFAMHGEPRYAVPPQNLDHVRDVVFTSRIVRLNFAGVLPEFRRIEAVQTGIDFLDLELFGRRRFLLDNRRHLALIVTHDPSIIDISSVDPDALGSAHERLRRRRMMAQA